MSNNNADYLTDLSRILKKRDVQALRSFLKNDAKTLDSLGTADVDGISDDELEERMYKMILARHELSELHADARRWMADHDKDLRF